MTVAAATLLTSMALVAGTGEVKLDPNHIQTVTFRAHHLLHTATGSTHDIEGSGRLLPDGTLQVMLRARIDSFQTGNGSENEYLAEALQPERFPYVVVKGLVTPEVPLPLGWVAPGQDAFDVNLDVPATIQTTFHGQNQVTDVPVHMIYAPDRHIKVSGSFPLDLTNFQVPLPSFFFMPIKKVIDLQFDLVWVPDDSVANAN